MKKELSKSFSPKDIESKWYEFWESQGFYKAGHNSKKTNHFSILLPPPNVTGSLHMGHGFNQTLMDALTRYHRMKGDNTLWQPGTDHAGIATQIVVERQLDKEGTDRHELGREKFIEKVWNWKAFSGGKITKQMRRLGTSPDWSRERFTMDEGLSKSVTEVFVNLYNDGLIYRGKRLVNWDVHLQTAVSDLEVIQEDESGFLWHINYPLKNTNDFLTIATTRPETMLGDSAIMVHPDDKRYKKFVGKKALIPLTNREIPIIADDYVDPTFGTGVVKVTPAHDFNDYAVGQRHDLPMINILGLDGFINDNGGDQYKGLERFEARKKIIEDLKKCSLLAKVEKHELKIPRGDRTGTVIEPMLTDQWFVAMSKKTKNDKKSIVERALEVVEKEEVKFYPPNWVNTYNQWLNNIQDWCISRQLWWGHQIPAWYGENDEVFVAHSFEDAKKLAKEKGYEGSLKRDEDVLDTWFSSGLWPFATLGWPDDKKYVDKFYPTSVLVTGFDIIFFWVARMIMFGTEFLNKEPFKDIYVHALVRDEKGQKMSKSKGNVIDPLDLIEKYSADALRFTLLSMASPGTDVKLSEDRVKGYRNFLNKLWNANNFLITNECDFKDIDKVPSLNVNINKWIYSELVETKNKIEKNLEDYRFDEAAKNAYQFAWHSYCDWYLELSKTILFSEDEKAKAEVKKVSSFVFKQILILLHPFIPFVTEEIWLKNKFDNDGSDYLMLKNWLSGEINKDSSTEQVENIINIISEIRSFKNELNVSPGSFIDVSISNINKNQKDFINTNEIILKKLGRINSILDKDLDKPAATMVVSGDLFKIYFDKDVDLKLIKENLTNKQSRLEQEMNKISQRLENKSFVDRAPKEIVEQEKNNYNNLKNDIEKISVTIKGI